MFQEELPVDKGWAWVICVAVFLVTYLITNSFQVLSVILLDLIEEFDTSITMASLIFMVKIFCVSFTSIISVNFLVPKYGIRVLGVLSGFVYAVCGILYAVAPNVGVFIALATIRGIAIGIISVPTLSMLGFYFNKYRSIATTMAVCGVSVSTITWPRLIRYILLTYDVKGALLINGAVEGNIIAFAMLLRPIELYIMPKYDVDVEGTEESPAPTVENSSENNKDISVKLVQLSNGKLLGHSDETTPQLKVSSDDVIYSDKDTKTPFIQDAKHEFEFYEVESRNSLQDNSSERRDTSENENYKTSLAGVKPGENLKWIDDLDPGPNDKLLGNSSTSDSQLAQYFHRQNSQTSHCKEKSLLLHVFQSKSSDSSPGQNPGVVTTRERLTSCSSAWSLVSGLEPGLGLVKSPEDLQRDDDQKLTCWQKVNQIFDFSLFKQWAFVWIIIATIPCGTNTFIMTYLPTIATFKGASKDDGALLLIIMGAMDLVARVAAGFLADSRRVRVSTILSCCGLSLGVICMFVSFYDDMTSLMAMSVGLGLFVGIRQSLGTIMFVEVVGLDNMAKGFSIYTMTTTVSLAAHNPLLGQLLESQGVDTVMYYIGGTSICWGIMFYVIPIVTRMETGYKKSKAKNLE